MEKGNFWARLFINAVTFLIVSSLYGGMTLRGGLWTAIVTALIFGIVNALLRPFLLLLTLPLNILTLGLFTFVVNGFILLITSALYSGLEVNGLFAGFVAAILFAIVSSILSSLLVDKKDD